MADPYSTQTSGAAASAAPDIAASVDSSSPQDSSLSDSDQFRRISNSWTDPQRVALLILRACYQLPWSEIAVIFNKLFAKDLADRGFFKSGSGQHGLGRGALEAQYTEMRGKTISTCQRRALRTVEAAGVPSKLPISYLPLGLELVATALASDIHLPRPVDFPRTIGDSQTGAKKAQKRGREESQETRCTELASDFFWDSDDLREKWSASSVKKRKSYNNNFLESMTPPQTPRKLIGGPQTPRHDGLPFLLFRAYCPSSAGINSPQGFHSGLQVTGSYPQDHDSRLIEFGAIHLNGKFAKEESVKKVPSPFISMSDSVLWVLKVAKSLQGPTRISLIEPRLVNKIYYTRPICREVVRSGEANFFRGKYTYAGQFEWWAWQKVPPEAIIADTNLDSLNATEDAFTQELLRMLDDKASTRAVQARCRAFCEEATLLDLGYSVASIISAFFKTTSINQPYALDFCRILLQNFGYTGHTDTALLDKSFGQAIQSVLHIRLPQSNDHDPNPVLTPSSHGPRRRSTSNDSTHKREPPRRPSVYPLTPPSTGKDRRKSHKGQRQTTSDLKYPEPLIFGGPLYPNEQGFNSERCIPQSTHMPALVVESDEDEDEPECSVKGLGDRVSRELSIFWSMGSRRSQTSDKQLDETSNITVMDGKSFVSDAAVRQESSPPPVRRMYESGMDFYDNTMDEHMAQQRDRSESGSLSPGRTLGANTPSPLPSPSLIAPSCRAQALAGATLSPEASNKDIDSFHAVVAKSPERQPSPIAGSRFAKWVYNPYE